MTLEEQAISRGRMRARVILILRIILWLMWGALLFGSFFFVIVIALTINSPSTTGGQVPDAKSIYLLLIIALVEAVVAIGVIRMVRFFVFRAALRKWSWTTLAVMYPIFKVLTWFLCNGPLYFCLVICLIARSFLPALPLAAAIWLCIAADPPLFLPFRRFELLRRGE